MPIHGETVLVSLRLFEGQDEYGNDVIEYGEPFEVANVLVGKADTDNEIEETQPYAIRADRRFCFPRGFDQDLRGAKITRNNVTYKVVGEPFDVTEENLPSLIPWNLRVEAVRFDG